MANPNIVNVTSIYAGNAAWSLTTTVTTTLWTVASDVVVKVNSIICTNTHATNATALTLDINGIGTTVTGVTGTSLATTGKIASTINIPSDDSLQVIDRPIYLMEQDVLRGGATSECILYVFFEVINDA